MADYSLIPHPDAPPEGVTAVSVRLDPVNGRQSEYFVEFRIAHDGSLLLPPMLEPARADELWKTTCCEVFVMPDGGSDYIEFNLSPSFRWAAYGFDGYRSGMHNVDLAFDPEIEITPDTPGWFWLAAELDLSSLASLNAKMNLTAVIEETDGTKSFWALAHAIEVPDFHNADCFTASLPAPAAS
ncbi:DOMON-like domain-containing protein [Sphingomonas panacisoli]|uniref:DOMON-like domain-containing protein n=1 Tax=Sphingomonas panacisoli TaxID=1813879 RepID=A0A5B8LHZ0_9SPHN|nr:DOMON-like domain-containing protein [Sphingomonas panacisoli]QDZ07234.1 DOMON-like domain-containing protein [Sphingomonas panacisoli]